jgi:hypothetical protein
MEPYDQELRSLLARERTARLREAAMQPPRRPRRRRPVLALRVRRLPAFRPRTS